MNRIQDYYVLNCLDLPTIPWKEYYHSTKLSKDILWTIKSEKNKKNNTELPRMIGVTAKEAKDFGGKLYKELGEGEMVFYYPYFFAIKSGIIDINYDRVAIEAVKDDVDNLVRRNNVDMTMIFHDDDLEIFGDQDFLTQEEILELIDCAVKIKKQCAADIEYGKNFLLQWSYACYTSTRKQPIGKKNLMFHKVKVI
ncbi:hypothetical protein [Anaeromicropila herbilytica]|uniref:Uncharacterized protein n=1 Tax=Anaeromicropila herbilytica TaxID=2785025 RepID=A0A7R7EHQ0_9FIRM|nr:hypothetical protein [Anaeromicropila herbilytica]BCN28876.1 hypothetical protein bsdtb5_01710 [Anaeromicropila herbilytica]